MHPSSEVPKGFLTKYTPARQEGQQGRKAEHGMRLYTGEAGIHTWVEKSIAG